MLSTAPSRSANSLFNLSTNTVTECLNLAATPPVGEICLAWTEIHNTSAASEKNKV